MAIQRAIITFSSSSTTTSRKFLLLSPTELSPLFVHTHPNRLPFARRRFKCSVEYSSSNHQSASAMEAYPKPAEIQWSKELCNTVHLIGVVGAAVEIKNFPSGKVLASTRLAVKKSATDTSWISLTFWDELANIAFQHVQKGQQIHVCGRLVSDTVVSDEGKSQTYYKVVVQQLNFIEKSFSSATSYDSSDSVGPGGKPRIDSGNGDETTEQLWQAFFASPLDWWDNRKTKRNPKYPDFKHKDTGEALWIEGKYNPPWVKSQLAILDTRMGNLNNQDSRFDSKLMAGDSVLNF